MKSRTIFIDDITNIIVTVNDFTQQLSMVTVWYVQLVYRKYTKKHDLIEISEAYDIKKDKLRKGQEKIKIKKSEVLNKKGLLERLKNGENAKYTRVIENIKNQEEALKQALHKHIEKIKNEVDQDQKTVLQSIDADIDTISRFMHQSNETNTEIEALINSTNISKFFFHEVSRMENSMDVPVPKTKSTYKSIPDFVPGGNKSV
ncbi:unnamed protein product [Mytilus edulis]|uniref:Uncharacterized protein n=1 Tax=Mytilus edulis TaxID=6550 RepID=A0A8S3Q551_MYTED|nr:unnamed protein product [Mytilus edulis]